MGDTKMKERAMNIGGGLFGLILAAAIASWQVMVVVAVIYAIGLFANLATGLLYAHQTNSYSEEKARHAIYKKGGAIVGILALFALDLLVMGVAGYFGITYSIPFFGCIFAGYNAVHEYRSMLENTKKLGNKVPQAIDDITKKAEEALNKGQIPRVDDFTKERKNE